MLRRFTFWIAVAVLTFVVGLTVSVILFMHSTQDVASLETSTSLVEAEEIREPFSCFPGFAVEVAKTKTSQGAFFPQGTFSFNEDSVGRHHEQFNIDWYSKHLAAMNEPPLVSLANKDTVAFRFLWLRTFHRPVVVRFQRSGQNRLLVVKQLSGAGGYDPGKISIETTRSLSAEEWATATRLFEQACFWQTPTVKLKGLNDGAQWIVEGVKKGRYHVVDRQSPDEPHYRKMEDTRDEAAYREACLYLLKLSGLKISEEEIY